MFQKLYEVIFNKNVVTLSTTFIFKQTNSTHTAPLKANFQITALEKY